MNLTQKLRNLEMAHRRGSIPDKGSFLQHCLGEAQCFQYTKKEPDLLVKNDFFRSLNFFKPSSYFEFSY